MQTTLFSASGPFEVPQVLNVGVSGPAVSLVHSWLLQLGLGKSIPAREVAERRYDHPTRKAVLQFQQGFKASGHVNPTGIYNEQTGAAMLQTLDERNVNGRYDISGRIVYSDGLPGAQLRVFILRHSLSSVQELAKAITDSEGYYLTNFTVDDTSKDKMAAGFGIGVMGNKDILYQSSIENTIRAAPGLIVSSVTLSTMSPFGLLDAFSKTMAVTSEVLAQHLDETLDAGASKSTTVRKIISRLRQDGEAKDISFIAGCSESRLTTQQIEEVVVSCRLADLAETHNVNISPEVFFTLVAGDNYQSATSGHSFAHIIRPVDIEADAEQLLRRLSRLSDETIRDCVTLATQQKLVSQGLEADLKTVVKGFAKLRSSLDTGRDERIVADNDYYEKLWTVIRPLLSTGKAELMKAFLVDEEHDLGRAYGRNGWVKSMASFLKDLQGSGPRKSPPSAISVAEPINPTLAFATRLRTNLGKDEALSRGLSTNPALTAKESARMMSAIVGNIKEVKLAPFARENRERGDALWAELSKSMRDPQGRKQAFKNGEAERISSFLSGFSHFDLTKTNIEHFFKQEEALTRAGDTESLKSSLKRLQRVFKVAPTYEQTIALLSMGVESSHAIEALGEVRLAQLFDQDKSLSRDDVSNIFRKAADVTLAANLVAAEFRGLSNALAIRSLSTEPVAVGKTEEATSAFPNLRSLFSFGDICDCDDCMSVYSPAAYFVDMLRFLRARPVLPGPNDPSSVPLTAEQTFLKRAFFTAYMDLNCNNTNITMPYIDLVCESLEAKLNPLNLIVAAVLVPAAPDLALESLRPILATMEEPFHPTILSDDATIEHYFTGDGHLAAVVRDPTFSIVLNFSIVTSGNTLLGWLVVDIPQTLGDSETLAAQPSRVDYPLYDQLKTVKMLPSLPFHLQNEESRSFFRQLGVSRGDLAHNLRPEVNAREIVVMESLGLSKLELDMIITPDRNPSEYWVTHGEDAVKILENVQSFLDTAQILYTDLTALMDATSWLNSAIHNQPLTIIHLDETCTLSMKEIKGLNVDALDRLHRFIRVWKRLSSDLTAGWTISALDRLIGMKSIGSGMLDAECLHRITMVKKLRDRATFATVHDVLDSFGPLIPRDSIPGVQNYERIFLDIAGNGPTPAEFPRNPGDVSSSNNVPAFVDYIARCLGVSRSEVTACIEFIEAQALSYETISMIYSLTALALTLKLPVTELLAISSLVDIDPRASPADAMRFMDSLDVIQKSRLSIYELQAILEHDIDGLVQIGEYISDSELGVVLVDLGQQFATTDFGPFHYEASASLDERQGAVFDMVQTLSAVSTSEVVLFRQVIIDQVFERAEEVLALISASIFRDAMGVATQQQIFQVFNDLFQTGTSSESLVETFLDSLAGILISWFTANAKEKLLQTTLKKALGLPEDHTRLLFRRTPLLDSVFDNQNGERLQPIQIISLVVSKLKINAQNFQWLLDFASPLGWAALTSFPVNESAPPLDFEEWVQLLNGHKILSSREFAPVDNREQPNEPITANRFFELLLQEETSFDQALKYLCDLTSWSPLSALHSAVETLGLGLDDLKNPDTLFQLQGIFDMTRRLNVTMEVAVQLVSSPDLTIDHVRELKAALKRMTPQNEWLQVLKSINDPIRVQKRDALLAYASQFDAEPRLTPKNLSDQLLIDVEMGPEQQTSRVFNSHLQVQRYVQRLRLGLEERSIPQTPEEEEAWKQWTWMSQYRLWEANRKVFLYPENWLDPQVRDDKTAQYLDFEKAMDEAENTTERLEISTLKYIEELEAIAHPEVVSSFYDYPTRTLHVFARMNGNESLYHAELYNEDTWSPFEEVLGPETSATHLISFVRNGTLTLAWPEFDLQQDPTQVTSPPNMINLNSIPTSGSLPNEKLRQRLAVKLAVSQRNPRTREWSSRAVSAEPVYFPYPDGRYSFLTSDPTTLQDELTLNYWDIGTRAGDVITIRGAAIRNKNFLLGGVQSLISQLGYGSNPNPPPWAAEDFMTVGQFALSGVKGFPVALRERDDQSRAKFIKVYPRVQETEYSQQRFHHTSAVEDEPVSLSVNSLVRHPFEPRLRTLLGSTDGDFRVTTSPQLSALDLIQYIDQYRSILPIYGNSALQFDQTIQHIGSLLPYFYSDSSGRTYSITPTFVPDNYSSGPKATTSDLYEFIWRALDFAKFTIDRYTALGGHTQLVALPQIEVKTKTHPRYLELVAEWDRMFRGREPLEKFSNFYHPLIDKVREAMLVNGFPGIFDRSTQLKSSSDFEAKYLPQNAVHPTYPVKEMSFDFSDVYATYNWELFFHLPLAIADRLNIDQRFAEAQQWMHYIFNPHGVAPEAGEVPGTSRGKYWITKPFFNMTVSDYASQRIDQLLGTIADDDSQNELTASYRRAVEIWRSNPFSPFAVARTRPVAFQIAIVLKYIKNIVDWADSLFRQLTRESLSQATQLYMLADELLGPKPQQVQYPKKSIAHNYMSLQNYVDDFGNALVELENHVPEIKDMPLTKGKPSKSINPGLNLFFSIPRNEQMLINWDLVKDRLFKIRHSQDIDGNIISLPLTAPPIDPSSIIRALASGVSLESLISNLSAPLPHYRFCYVVDQAVSFTSLVTELGTKLLSILEKRDAEGLARLQSDHATIILNAMTEVKQTAIRESEDAIEAISASRESAALREQYYRSLHDQNLNGQEKAAVSLNILALRSRRISLRYQYGL